MATSEFDPIALARAEAIDTAHEPEDVGEFVTSEAHDDGVTDFRFEALMKGYEGWQWSVTLYHDVELDHWTIDESSLIPTDKALLPPKWVPWKDRLLPSDLSVTDSIGTPEDDERLDDGIGIDEAVSRTEELNAEQQAVETVQAQEGGSPDEQADALTAVEDVVEAVEELDLSRRHVLSELGQTQTAQRWYEGPHGPKSLSTKTADGNLCSTCGFFIPLAGSLKTMFGVCANRWSPDDGKVVSVDHGCGEHSEIRPPEPSRMWVQTKPESLAGLKQKALDMDDDMPDTSSFGIGSVSPQDFSGEEPEADSTVERSAAKEVCEDEDAEQIDSMCTSETVIAEEAGE